MVIELRRTSPNFAEFDPPAELETSTIWSRLLHFLRLHLSAVTHPRFELGYHPKGCKRRMGPVETRFLNERTLHRELSGARHFTRDRF
jgi:hypothetical protein